MSRFAPLALIVACLAAPASAFTFSLPDLSFPDSATTVSTQSCDLDSDDCRFRLQVTPDLPVPLPPV